MKLITDWSEDGKIDASQSMGRCITFCILETTKETFNMTTTTFEIKHFNNKVKLGKWYIQYTENGFLH